MSETIMEEVPTYKSFYTVDELKSSSEKLASKHPDKVKIFEIGKSRKGEKIKALRIGKGKKTALLFGFPHPDEPIGSMTLEYLAQRLTENGPLDKLDFTWYIVKCIDPDGARLNEGWFKGPFTPIHRLIDHLALNYYRPPGYQQIEWNFPIRYKTLRWNKPIPETKALMKIIDTVKPSFMYSLHNSAFGGVYFYVSDPCKPLYPKLQNLAKKENLLLHLGEPEAPFIKELAKAVFNMPAAAEIYDFLEKCAKKDPAKIISGGTCGSDYARRVAQTFTLVCETPYYYDARIADTSESDISRKDAVLYMIKLAEERFNFIKQKYSQVKSNVKKHKEKRPFIEAIEDFLKHFPDNIAARKQWAQTDPKVNRTASIAEKFDSCVISRFNMLPFYGMLYRCVKETENEKIEEEVLRKIKEGSQELEKQLNYKVIPIKSLVRVQLGSALFAAEYIRSLH